MTAADTKTMIDKLRALVATGYMSTEEDEWVAQVISQAILTGEEVRQLEAIYNRLYSVRTT